MDVERTFTEVSWFFHAWVGIMENHTREMEVNDSSLHNSKILIVSPPTDKGLKALSRANQLGSSYLLCLSPRIESIAKKYCRRRGIQGIQTVTAPYLDIPIGAGELDAIYANCFFDCCPPADLNATIDEFRRMLKPGGTLYSVQMGIPSRRSNHLWAFLFRNLPGPTRGFHPVNIVPPLSSRGFSVLRNQRPEKFGFPLHYVEAKHQKDLGFGF